MTKNKKYGYQDWWDGKIYLTYSTILISTVGDKTSVGVSWDQIIEAEIPFIKKKQKEIFENAVNETLEKWKEDFSNRYANSKFPKRLLEDDFHKFENIILGAMPVSARGFEVLNYNGVLFDYISLSAIKNYITSTKVNGIVPDFDFIHSPNFSSQKQNAVPEEVYGESCWQYINWIKEFQLRSDNHGVQNESESSLSLEENGINEPRNPFPLIFKNGHGYNIFFELKEAMVHKLTELADYSYIYYRMKHDDSHYINSTVTHAAYISFLNTTLDAGIKSPKLKIAKTKRKEQMYNSILEKYKSFK